MGETLSVAAIKNGTVIDHITAGQSIRIMKLLGLQKKKATLGMNLPSKSLGLKDLIKVEDFVISDEAAGQIAVFAPQATINIVQDFNIVRKYKVALPNHLNNILGCLNPRCITNHERASTCFSVQHIGKKVALTCNYCEKSFAHDAF